MTINAAAQPNTAAGSNAAEGMLADRAAGASSLSEFISFAIGDDQYGVDIMAVREIKGWSNVTHLPKQPDYVRGVLNLRGVMVPIIDLRCRFGQGVTEATPMHIVIIVQIEDRQVGILGDRVLDIVSFEAGKIQAVPKVAAGLHTSFLSGLVTVEGAMLALIDLPNLLAVQAEESASLSVIETKPAIATQSN